MSRFISNAFQVPNAVIDELMANLSPNALKCYLLIVRKTTGWGKVSDRISESQFIEKTGIKNVKTVRTAMVELCELNLIKQVKKLGQITEYSLVLDSENQCQKTVVPKNGTSTKKRTEVVPKNGTTTSTKNWHSTKDTIKTTNTKEKIYKKDSPKTQVGLDFSKLGFNQSEISEFKNIRRSKKTIISQRVINSHAQEFELSRQSGMTNDDILTLWANKGWSAYRHEWAVNALGRAHKQSVQASQVGAADADYSRPEGY